MYLRPHQPVAERVLVPGDPARAMRLANALTDKPLMLNHARGLWGYTGTATDGELLTVQSSGLGGPSAAAVVRDLVALGARRMVRVGTCRSDSLRAGAIVRVGDVTMGAEVHDMTTEGFLAAAEAAGVEAGALLVVLGGSLTEDELHAAELTAGQAALDSLSKA